MKPSPSEEFIGLYNNLDAYMRKTLRADRHVEHGTLLREMSTKNRIFQDYLVDLRMFAEMRNMLVHNPYKKDADPLLHPHGYILKKYEEIINLIQNPPKALFVAIPGPNIYTAKLSTNAQDLMRTMVKNNYTHIPIIENGVLVGIFSENTLLSYLVANKECIILEGATVSDFKGFIELENHMNEYFGFVGRNTPLSKVEEIFNLGLKDGKRVSVVYVTENGKKEEKFLGMITAWDLTSRTTA